MILHLRTFLGLAAMGGNDINGTHPRDFAAIELLSRRVVAHAMLVQARAQEETLRIEASARHVDKVEAERRLCDAETRAHLARDAAARAARKTDFAAAAVALKEAQLGRIDDFLEFTRQLQKLKECRSDFHSARCEVNSLIALHGRKLREVRSSADTAQQEARRDLVVTCLRKEAIEAKRNDGFSCYVTPCPIT